MVSTISGISWNVHGNLPINADADSFLKSEEFADQEAAAFVRYWLDPNRSGPEPVVLPSCIIYRTCGPKLAAGMSEG